MENSKQKNISRDETGKLSEVNSAISEVTVSSVSENNYVYTQKIHEIVGSLELIETDESFTQEMRDSLDVYISSGGDVNGASDLPSAWHGDLPLHTAIVKGNQSLISYLIEHGADPTCRDPRKDHTCYERLLYTLEHCWPGDQEERLNRTKLFIEENYSIEFGISGESKQCDASAVVSASSESKSESSVSESSSNRTLLAW